MLKSTRPCLRIDVFFCILLFFWCVDHLDVVWAVLRYFRFMFPCFGPFLFQLRLRRAADVVAGPWLRERAVGGLQAVLGAVKYAPYR